MQRQNSSHKLDRVNEELKREISNIINYKLKNSKVTGMISITKVKVTPDLRYARVWISVLNCKNKKDTLLGLKQSSGYIRSEIAHNINMRITPELVFEFDDTMEYGERIDTILNEIMKDVKKEDGKDT
ncbi:MAG: 30S ribosome-binding factor RbfA [Clostridia bacterium]|nr:30S ribosome-binding factor RbfA [Clostridia bacterium]